MRQLYLNFAQKTQKQKTKKLDGEIRGEDLYDLEVKGRIKIYGINQDLSEEYYNKTFFEESGESTLLRFIKESEKWLNAQFRVSLPVNQHGKRYVLIERLK